MIQNLSTGFCRRNNNTDCTTNVAFSKMHVFVHYNTISAMTHLCTHCKPRSQFAVRLWHQHRVMLGLILHATELVLEIPDTHTHTRTGSNKHTTDSPQIYTHVPNSMSMKSSSKASDTRQQVIPGMPHGGRASPSAALSPVLAAPAEGWNASAPWRHGWKVMKSLESMGKHGKTTMGTMKFWKHLENYSLCVFCVCVFFIPDHS